MVMPNQDGVDDCREIGKTAPFLAQNASARPLGPQLLEEYSLLRDIEEEARAIVRIISTFKEKPNIDTLCAAVIVMENKLNALEELRKPHEA